MKAEEQIKQIMRDKKYPETYDEIAIYFYDLAKGDTLELIGEMSMEYGLDIPALELKKKLQGGNENGKNRS